MLSFIMAVPGCSAIAEGVDCEMSDPTTKYNSERIVQAVENSVKHLCSLVTWYHRSPAIGEDRYQSLIPLIWHEIREESESELLRQRTVSRLEPDSFQSPAEENPKPERNR